MWINLTLVVIVEPLIQDDISPRPASPSPKAKNVPPMPTTIYNTTVFQGGNQAPILKQLFPPKFLY